ncbi:putative homoserine dehydrogenase-like protein [Halanaerobium sp. MA284_MarDTE_T2]|nr:MULTISPECIES: SAF domain-containing protein [unclassified Halanaerobium]RCW47357.1 putative homoserine dehydrogenase-like protein [Halanaerobium sp. MA284_MarDTE_T2]RCW84896.1 putative homoserine dehydrogenase-like protein [Halanaerobium sp. DL-01]
MRLYNELKKRESMGNKIKVALVGAGQMGTDIVSMASSMPGLDIAVVVDINLENAQTAYKLSGLNGNQIRESSSKTEIEDLVMQDKAVITSDSNIVTEVDNIDVVIDATGVPEVGAEVGLNSIMNGKDIVMMNVEADVVIGPILNKMAKRAGVTYTGAAGDEPAAIMEIYDYAKSMGLEVVAAGKGKNNPLQLDANPDTVRETAEKKGTTPRMLATFVDGTKTMVEMAAVSNATGLVPDVVGMHGPTTNVEDLPQKFSLKEQGGILNSKGVVDYSLGNVAPGVFVIVTSDNQRVKDSFAYSKMGSGPNYLLYRPYHLVSLETPISAARAVIKGEAAIAPEFGLVSETITVAKKDLKTGETLDGIGGFTVHGSIEKAETAREKNLLPLGLTHGAVMKTDVKKGDLLTYDDVEIKKDSIIYQLRMIQDKML